MEAATAAPAGAGEGAAKDNTGSRTMADLALLAAEKATAGALDGKSHRKLIDDAVRDLDFSALEESRN